MTTEIELMKRWEDLCSSGSQVPPLIERQFVNKVTSFSSEYGAGDSNWGACNICGPPRVYPKLGDDAKTWATSTNNGKEYVVVELEKPCIPTKIEVYETSAPGALVKISGQVGQDWVVLWSGSADLSKTGAARIFEPPLSPVQDPIKVYRFDTDATGWSNWYEIDAIAVTGAVRGVVGPPAFRPPAAKSLAGDLLLLLNSQSGDVTFTTPTGEVIRAHSTILLARCPSMLKSHDSSIHVPDHPTVLRAVLTYLYTDSVEISTLISVPLYVAALRWGIEKLAALSAQHFATALTTQNVFGFLQFVDQLPDLRLACLDFLVRCPSLLLAPLNAAECKSEDNKPVETPGQSMSHAQLVLLVQRFAEASTAKTSTANSAAK